MKQDDEIDGMVIVKWGLFLMFLFFIGMFISRLGGTPRAYAEFEQNCVGVVLPPNETAVGKITDISYNRARGATAPERWWINTCVEEKCRVIRLDHAPWSWMIEGADVMLTVSYTCEFGNIYTNWTIRGKV